MHTILFVLPPPKTELLKVDAIVQNRYALDL